ncbi:two-component regulator propeller domain-containing protein [uncultured Flavobacterium sp.]|uniref:ligand-binding sensor domain-containing protein n=1 Tax=uncultured Flavobacterium sp. TaxID=165435 RepID=UPI0025F5DF92|nr:two-component regulator propeller domain-containing protein [uncultured Flavobacterium sp.]
MIARSRFIHLIFCLFLLLASVANSQTHALRFKRVTSNQGLTTNRATAVMQDHNGVLWIGNKIAINSYDGELAKVYHVGENNSINQFFEDDYGNIWAATEEGLYFLDKRKNHFKLVKSGNAKADRLLGYNILCIVQIKGNELLIGGTKDFLVRLKVNKKGEIEDNSITVLDKQKINGYITKIVKENNSKFWLGTDRGEVFCMERDRIIPTDFMKAGNGSFINDMAIDIFQNLWIATNGNGLYCLNAETKNTKHFLKEENKKGVSINNNIVTKVYAEGKNVWIGTDGGGLNLYVQDEKKFNYFTYDFGNEFSISDNSIIDIQPGLNDVILLGTVHGGISIFRNNYKTENIPADHFQFLIQDPQGSKVLQDSDKNIWLSAGRAGLRRYNPRTKELNVFLGKGSGFSGDIVLSLFEDSAKRLWAGTLREGVNVYDLKKNKFIALSQGRTFKGVFAVEEDKIGNIWVGHRQGITIFSKDLKVIQEIKPDSNIYSNSNQVNCIYKDIVGTMWIGTTNGLFKYEKRGNVLFKSAYKHNSRDAHSLSSSYVLSIGETFDHSILVGTYGEGLNKLVAARGKFEKVRNADKIKGGIIRGILQDNHKNIWLSTNRGLTKIDPNGTISNFGLSDGIYPFNGGAASLDSDGKILMAGVYGLTYFNPEKLSYKTYFPHVYFTSVKGINGKNEKVYSLSKLSSDTVVIEPNSTFLNINFSTSELYSKGAIEYEFQLVGLDENWQNLNGQSKVSFSNLNPGKYELRIRATTNSKLWDKKYTSLFITVEPSFWQRTIVRIMMFIYFIGILLLIYNWRTSTIKKQKQKLEKLLELKTIEVTEQEQKISQGKISILEYEKQNEVLKQKKLEDELTFKIDELTNNTLRTIHKNNLLNDIKDKLKAELKNRTIDKTSLQEIVDHISDSFILDADWESFYSVFNQVHPTFIKSLKRQFPALTEREVRLCALILINFSSQHMATLFGISLTSVKVARHRLRKKLDIPESISVKKFLSDLSVD